MFKPCLYTHTILYIFLFHSLINAKDGDDITPPQRIQSQNITYHKELCDRSPKTQSNNIVYHNSIKISQIEGDLVNEESDIESQIHQIHHNQTPRMIPIKEHFGDTPRHQGNLNSDRGISKVAIHNPHLHQHQQGIKKNRQFGDFLPDHIINQNQIQIIEEVNSQNQGIKKADSSEQNILSKTTKAHIKDQINKAVLERFESLSTEMRNQRRVGHFAEIGGQFLSLITPCTAFSAGYFSNANPNVGGMLALISGSTGTLAVALRKLASYYTEESQKRSKELELLLAQSGLESIQLISTNIQNNDPTQ